MKRFAWFIVGALSLVVAGKAIYLYGFTPLEYAAPAPFVSNYRAHSLGIYAHVFAAVVALLLGPFQFSSRLRQRQPRLHRWIGRTYLGIGVLLGGLTGLYMSVFAFGGWAVKLGFACLALGWLFTGYMALRAIRAGAVDRHRAYMVRNFALTLAAVCLRFYLPAAMAAGVEFTTAYALIAWLCWVPNLVLAEVFFNQERWRERPAAPPTLDARAMAD